MSTFIIVSLSVLFTGVLYYAVREKKVSGTILNLFLTQPYHLASKLLLH
jgi:hypothetical protein